MIHPNPKSPFVSVFMPMADHRGMAIEAIESWVNGQHCDPATFELILITDETLRDMVKKFRQLLRPHDKLIDHTANEMEQYDIGTRQAKGRIFFFTEPHCAAEPEAVSEIIHYFETHDLDGVCIRSTPICPNRIAQMEARMYDDGFAEWSQPDDWRKVIIRGFGIRRQVYLEVGGFNYHYSRFAEWLLAATLHIKGYRLGYTPRVGISHIYADNLKLLDLYIKEFTDGECLYRLENRSETVERYFGSPPEWYEARSFDSELTLLLVSVLFRQLRRQRGMTDSWVGRQACFTQLLRLLPLALRGKKLLPIPFVARVWWAKLRCYGWWFNDNRMYRAFTDYYTSTTSLNRVKFAVKSSRQRESINSPCLSYAIEDVVTEDILGFHALELYEGQPFRWSSAVSALRVQLPPADYRTTIQLNEVRPLVPTQELSIFLNSHPVSEVAFDRQQHTLTFRTPKSTLTSNNQWLVFLCKPWELSNPQASDLRSLGLPLVSVDFKPE